MTELEKKLKTPAEANLEYQRYVNGTGIRPFRYDWNEDALYQQAVQRYQQLGRAAMMDTMGQAAALTGGYGNSYAQSAGQQAYQGYLQGIHDQLPQYRQMALDQYKLDLAQFRDSQTQARAQADYLLAIGIRPDDALLGMTGYAPQYVEQLLQKAVPAWTGTYTPPTQETAPVTTYPNGTTSAAELAAGMLNTGNISDSAAKQALVNLGYTPERAQAVVKQKRILDELLA